MSQAHNPTREVDLLRAQLTKLNQACLRINESLDFDTVLQGVLDGARSLANARYGVITLMDADGQIRDFLSSGLTIEQSQQFWNMPNGVTFFAHMSKIQEPLRIADFHSHTRALGLPEFRPPMPVSSVLPFMAAPIHNREECIGGIYLADRDQEFTPEDEETMVMFASQASLVIANARVHREERRARADLEALISMSPVGVAVFDVRTGEIKSVNREAQRIVSHLHDPGTTAQELLERLNFRRADGRKMSLDELPLSKALSSGETVRAEEIVLYVPEGRSVSTLVNATPILSDSEDVESVIVTLQDLTPLENLERIRAEFLGMVSHELRAPLTSIKGSATTLLESASDLDPAEARQFHRIINDQANHMRNLINDLLDVVRIETGSLSVRLSPVPVADLVEEARNRFVSAGGRNNLHIDLALDLPSVMADKRRLGQVLDNLMTNAARNSHESTPISVSAVHQDFQVAISVTDKGKGLPPERLPHLFSKFSRMSDEDTESGVMAAGLGLAICKGIVEAHGGRIWAESEGLEKGAKFTITVPVFEDAGAESLARIPDGSEAINSSGKQKRRILAADDDPLALRYIGDTLSKAGYAAVVTTDPKDVSILIQAKEPDLILLDLMLPGTNGIELMGEILEITDVPVIFLSAYGQDHHIARAFEAGAVDYVVKPFSQTELVARINAALRRHRTNNTIGQREPFHLGALTINYAEHRVSVADRPVELTATEFRFLAELSTNAGMVLTYEQLQRRVWGPTHSDDLRPVRTVVKNLRRKIGDDARTPTYLTTIPRVGYRLSTE